MRVRDVSKKDFMSVSVCRTWYIRFIQYIVVKLLLLPVLRMDVMATLQSIDFKVAATAKSCRKVKVSHAAVKSFDRCGVRCRNARIVQISCGVKKCPVTQKLYWCLLVAVMLWINDIVKAENLRPRPGPLRPRPQVPNSNYSSILYQSFYMVRHNYRTRQL